MYALKKYTVRSKNKDITFKVLYYNLLINPAITYSHIIWYHCPIFSFLEQCEVEAVGVQKSRILGYIYTIILSQCEKKWILSKEEKRSSCSSKALEKKSCRKIGSNHLSWLQNFHIFIHFNVGCILLHWSNHSVLRSNVIFFLDISKIGSTNSEPNHQIFFFW